MEQRRRRHFIAGLRAVAGFYEQNPDAAAAWLLVRASYRPASCPQPMRYVFPRPAWRSSNGNAILYCPAMSIPDRLISNLYVLPVDFVGNLKIPTFLSPCCALWRRLSYT